MTIFSDNILLDEGQFREGSSGVVIFSVVIVEEDGIIVGVEGVKVCSSSIPLSDP